jgi:methionyl-tRNA formyltransferase
MKIILLTKDLKIAQYFGKSFQVISSLDDLPVHSSIIVMISYPHIVPEDYLKVHIFLNVHNSLLPKYRGLHAFTWAIINGEDKLGYTLHLVGSGIDNGPIINQVEFEIDFSDDINSVFKRAQSVLFKWLDIQLHNLDLSVINDAVPQDDDLATYVCKRRITDSQICWGKSAFNIHNLIRAVAPPYTEGAFSRFREKSIFFPESNIYNNSNYIGVNGQVINVENDGSVLIKCGSGILRIKKVIVDEEVMKPNQLIKKVGARIG